MKYTQIPSTAFQNIQMNAGILVTGATGFAPSTGTISGALMGATTGGVSFTATPTFTDQGSDIDNCPKNMLELKKLESWEAKMTGTFVTVSADLTKLLVGAGVVDSADATHIIPRNDILSTDAEDIWWIGDYSDVNEDGASQSAGFCAVHLMSALSTGGFQIKSADKSKGQFAFEFTGHYTMANQSKVPFEVYVKQGA